MKHLCLLATAAVVYDDSGSAAEWLTVSQGLSDETNFSALFAPEFAQKLQGLEIIADAGNITLDDMEKIAAITELNVSGSSLTSLQGIEYFESLTTLLCASNSLETLDVSNNTELEDLQCYENQLTKLDVSKNTALTWLSCDYNQLPTLDVSNNTELTMLWCNENQLTELDVNNNTKLEILYCDTNKLETLDVSNNPALTELQCFSNQLTELDVSKNTALIYLDCNGNPGDGESVFPVKVWADFNLNSIPSDFTKGSWEYGGKTITIDYRTATAE